MKKEQILNNVIAKNGYTTFLELTLGESICGKIECKVAQTVSDISKVKRKYDLIFIDGEHTHEQCEKDIINACKLLNQGGLIALHDINPEQIEQQEVPRKSRLWTGDVWRCYVGYPGEKRAFLEDWGIGFLEPVEGLQPGFSSTMKAKEFMDNKENLLTAHKSEPVKPTKTKKKK